MTGAAVERPQAAPVDADVGTVSVVVMAYNEAETLEPTVREIATALSRIPGSHEVIIVDDGSTDATPAIADALATRMPGVRTVHHAENAGLGGVYRTGFAEARSDLLTFFPADGQFPAPIIGEFHGAVASADLVLGYVPERRSPWVGRALSMIERAIYAVLFGGMPRFQGIFMCRRALLAALTLRSSGRGWAVVMELILRGRRAGWRIVSRPTAMRPRAAGRSKVNNLRTILANTRQMLALRRLLRDRSQSASTA